jgi:hypothetical protein
MSRATRPVAVSRAAHVLSPGILPNVAYAQVKFATPCAFMSRATRPVAVSRAAHVLSPGILPNVAYAQVKFATRRLMLVC